MAAGAINLDGSLAVAYGSAFLPPPGVLTSFMLLNSATGRSGVFVSQSLPPSTPQSQTMMQYDSNNVRMIAGLLPGYFIGSSGSSWFTPSNWGDGAVPNASVDVTIQTSVHIDQTGALADDVNIEQGGQLLIGGSNPGHLACTSVTIQSGSAVQIDATGTIRASAVTINSGATLALTQPTSLLATASLTLQPGATLTWVAGTIQINGGTLSSAGSLNIGCTGGDASLALMPGSIVNAPSIHICANGEVSGNGTIIGPISNGGDIAPGASPGHLAMAADYSQPEVGELDIQIGGTTPQVEFDVLSVGGIAALDGSLQITLINGYTPPIGSQFQFLTASSTDGRFATVQTPALADARMVLTYNAAGAKIEVRRTGDVNGDNVVNADDLLAVINQWGACPNPLANCSADLNGDHFVDVDDLLSVIAHWG